MHIERDQWGDIAVTVPQIALFGYGAVSEALEAGWTSFEDFSLTGLYLGILVGMVVRNRLAFRIGAFYGTFTLAAGLAMVYLWFQLAPPKPVFALFPTLVKVLPVVTGGYCYFRLRHWPPPAISS
jgi:hypothetical protein